MRVLFLSVILVAISLAGSGCVRRVTVAEVLPVQSSVPTEELINRINRYGNVETFSAQADVLVRNYFTGVGTKADEFPIANGALRLRRAENIRMQVRAPVINSNVADMVSDGQRFKLAIYYPRDKRRFIHGTNLKDLDRMGAQELIDTKDRRLAQAGGLINMRPQHITDAFLIKAAKQDERTQVFREEVRQEEKDTRPGNSKRTVIKSYYVIYVLERGESGMLELRRKFWFDRNLPGATLVRQQTFENGSGKLASDIWYSDWVKVPDNDWVWPRKVLIDRLQDGYRLELSLGKDSIEINAGIPDTAFTLENTENMEEVDLDAPRKSLVKQGNQRSPLPKH